MERIISQSFSSREQESFARMKQFIANAFGNTPFQMNLCQTMEAFSAKYIKLDLPLAPENVSQKINLVEIEITDNCFTFSYHQPVKQDISSERGCIAANAINEFLDNLPLRCIYQQYCHTFEIVSVFHSPDAVVTAINGLLCVLEYIAILAPYLDGMCTPEQESQIFQTLAACCGYVDHHSFIPENIYIQAPG